MTPRSPLLLSLFVVFLFLPFSASVSRCGLFNWFCPCSSDCYLTNYDRCDDCQSCHYDCCNVGDSADYTAQPAAPVVSNVSVSFSWTFNDAKWSSCASSCGTPCTAGKYFEVVATHQTTNQVYVFQQSSAIRNFSPTAAELPAGRYSYVLNTVRVADWAPNYQTKTPKASASASTTFCLPSYPDSLGFSQPANGAILTVSSLTLSWQLPTTFGVSCITPQTNSIILRSFTSPTLTSPGTLTTLTTLSDTGGSYSLSGLPSGRHWFQVGASNGYLTTWSSVISVDICTLSSGVTLSSPANAFVQATTTALSSTTVSWSTYTFPFYCGSGSTKYEVRITPSGGSQTSYPGNTGTSLLLSNLAIDTWSWSVVASNLNVASPSSGARTFVLCLLAAPSVPSLVGPTSGSLIVEGVDVPLAWAAPSSFGNVCGTVAQNNTYVLSIKNSDTQVVTNFNFLSGTLTFNISTLELGSYEWWITAKNGLHETASTRWVFNIGSSCIISPPSDPFLVSPAALLLIPVTSVSFSWGLDSVGNTCGASGVSEFTLYLDTVDPPVSIATTTEGLSFDATGLPTGTHYWQVSFTNAAGNTTESSIHSFEVCQPTGMNTPVLSSPSDGSTIGAQPAFAWADATPDVYCNKEADSPIVYTISASCEGCQEGSEVVLTSFSQTTTLTDYSISSPYSLQAGLWTFNLTAESQFYSLFSDVQISFYVCVPAVPVAGSLLSPPNLSFNQRPDLNLTFEAADFGLDYDGCSNVLNQTWYDVYISKTSPVQLVSENLACSGDISHCAPTNISSGIWRWTVVARKELEEVALSQQYTTRQFQVCVNVDPIAPQLSGPENGTVANLTLSNRVVLSWVPLSSYDFGVVCSYTGFDYDASYAVYYGRNPENITLYDRFVSADNQTANIANLLQSGETYYWKVVASNGYASASSEVYSFTVWKANPNPTDRPTSPGQNQTPDGLMPWQIGAIVGGLAAALMILLIAIFLVHRKTRQHQKKGDEEEMPPLVKPDFIPIIYPTYLEPALANASDPSWKPFLDLVLSPDFVFVHLVIEEIEKSGNLNALNEFVTSLTYVFEKHKRATDLVKLFVSREIRSKEKAGTLEESTLFRGDNAGAKSFNTYSKIVGTEYLFDTLAPFLHELNYAEKVKERHKERQEKVTAQMETGRSSSTFLLRGASTTHVFQESLEMDPTKMSEEDSKEVNQLALELVCERFLQEIFRSAPQFPVELKDILNHTKRVVDRSLPGATSSAVAGFAFLRFINLALVTPVQYGILDEEPSKQIRRELLLISKVLQNVANGTVFKEQHMEAMNKFVERNRGKIYQYFDTISSADSEGKPTVYAELPKNVYNKAVFGLYEILEQYIPQLEATLQQGTVLNPEKLTKFKAELSTVRTSIDSLKSSPIGKK